MAPKFWRYTDEFLRSLARHQMTDVHDKKTRSYNMSRIRAKDTKPEMIVRKCLFSKGFRYRLHDGRLPGKPDLVLPKFRTVIFVNGCFWHGHKGCKYFVLPKNNQEWWLRKINRNRELDEKNTGELNRTGWQVITIFECELKKGKLESTLENTIRRIRQSDNQNN